MLFVICEWCKFGSGCLASFRVASLFNSSLIASSFLKVCLYMWL